MMDGQDLAVFCQLRDWLDQDEQVWLCTIVATNGSSPRPVGAMLGITHSHQIGSLSGGCVEEDLIEKLRSGELEQDTPTRVEYGVSAEENERLGLPCGGKLDVLIERVSRKDSEWLKDAISALESRKVTGRRLDLTTGKSVIEKQTPDAVITLDATTMIQSLGPQMRMLLVGAGQLAQVLSQLAVAMDYQVVVTDTRPDVLNQWAGPRVTLVEGLPDDVISTHAVDQHSLIITLTHDPRIDDMALLEALDSPAWYVGALGSLRTTRARLRRLRELGLSEQQLARLRAPVGLDIGSKTPWEIAVAIMAEITRERKATGAPGAPK
jgi:xanthine dehydrogenase accessory factor